MFPRLNFPRWVILVLKTLKLRLAMAMPLPQAYIEWIAWLRLPLILVARSWLKRQRERYEVDLKNFLSERICEAGTSCRRKHFGMIFMKSG